MTFNIRLSVEQVGEDVDRCSFDKRPAIFFAWI